MKHSRYWFIVVVLIALVSAGCTRSAHKDPIPAVPPTPTFPFPVFPTQGPAITLVPPQTSPDAKAAIPINQGTQPEQTPNPGQTDLPATTGEAQAPTAEPTAIIVPTATPGLPETYTLHQGEHVFCLARRFNLNPVDLLSANGLSGNEFLNPGFIIKIPASGGKWSVGDRALQPHPATYNIAPGDTIFSVACKYGDVDPNAIIYANQLSEPYELKAGGTLRIP